MESNTFSNDAFICYTRADKKIADYLYKTLLDYELPKSLEGTGLKDKIKNVFIDVQGMTSGQLPDRIYKALEDSEYLIVVCSKNTKDSKWVSDEINYYINLGREKNILALLVSGRREQIFPKPLLDLNIFPADIRSHLGLLSHRKLHKEKYKLIGPILGFPNLTILREANQNILNGKTIKLFTALLISLAISTSAFAYHSYSIGKQKEIIQKQNEELINTTELAIIKTNEASIALDNERNANSQKQKAIEDFIRQKEIAIEERKRAEEQERNAIEQKNRAEEQEIIAKVERDNALLNYSEYLSVVSKEQTDSGEAAKGMLLALSAINANPYRYDSAYMALDYAFYSPRELYVIEGVYGKLFFLNDNIFAIRDKNNHLSFYDSKNGILSYELPCKLGYNNYQLIENKVIINNGTYQNDSIQVWDIENKTLLNTLSGKNLKLSKNGNHYLELNDTFANLYDRNKNLIKKIFFNEPHSYLSYVGFTANENYFIVSLKDKVELYNISGELIDIFPNRFDNISISGNYLSTESSKNYTVYNCVTHQSFEIRKNENVYDTILFSPDEKYLVCKTDADKIEIWNLSDIKCVKKIQLFNKINSIVISPDSNHILVISDRSELIDRDGNYEANFLSGGKKGSFSKDSKKFNIMSRNGFVVYNIYGQSLLDIHNSNEIEDVRFGDLNILVASFVNGFCKIWDIVKSDNSAILLNIENNNYTPSIEYSTCITEDLSKYALYSGKTLTMWNGQNVIRKEFEDYIWRIQLLSGNKIAVFLDNQTTIYVLYMINGEVFKKYEGMRGITAISGDMLAIYSENKSKLIDLTGEREYLGDGSKVVNVFASGNKDMIVVNYANKTELWKGKKDKVEIYEKPDNILFDPKGRYFIYIYQNGLIIIRSIDGHAIKSYLFYDFISEESVKISPDGKYIAIPCLDMVHIWDWEGENIQRIYEKNIYKICFDSSSKLIALRNNENIYIYNMDIKYSPVSIIKDKFGIYDMALASDLKYFFAACEDGTVRKWRIFADRKDMVYYCKSVVPESYNSKGFFNVGSNLYMIED